MLDARELIKQFETNFRAYYQLLHPLQSESPLKEQLEKNGEFFNFLTEQTLVQDEVIEFRLQKILEQEHPYLTSIDPEKLKKTAIQRNRSLNQLISHFLEKRKALLKQLYSLPTEAWKRTAILAEEGRVSFGEIVRRMIEKDQPVLRRLQTFIQATHAS